MADLPQDFGTILIIYVTFILHDGRTQAEVGSIPALSSSSVYARVISYHPFSSFTVGRMKFSFFFFFDLFSLITFTMVSNISWDPLGYFEPTL